MREQLHRAKRIDNKEWVEGYYFHDTDKRIVTTEADYIIGFEDKNDSQMQNIEVFPKTLCEFSGEYDRCHKRIFEDDFLKDENGFVYRVVFEAGAFCLVAVTEFNIPYDTLPKDTDSDEFDGNLADNIVPIYVLKWNNSEWNTNFEIIGNLHDNPELLERRLPL